jgi:energy-coupling factor transport system permease protein
LWALGMAVAASRTRNPVLLVLILAVTGFVVAARRSDAPWANSYTAFLKLGLVVIGVRVVLQALLSTRSQGNTVLFTLPLIPLPEWANGVKLGGEVTLEALLTALYDGGQLAVMLCCIGAANALASPRRLLKSLPGALYEIGVACVVALTFAPQLVTDARRIRAARRLRGRTNASFRTTAMPVLEGALDRSVELAAAMDSRGYGRTAHVPRRQRRITGVCVLLGLLGILLGVYALLTDSMAFPLAATALAIGLLLAVGAMALGRQRVTRTQYRPDPWALPEWLVVASGAIAAGTMITAAARGVEGLVLAGPLVVPPVPLLPVIGILIGLAPAVVAPPLKARRRELVTA